MFYCKPLCASNFYSSSYLEYNGHGDRNKTLSIEDFLNKIRQHLKGIKDNL